MTAGLNSAYTGGSPNFGTVNLVAAKMLPSNWAAPATIAASGTYQSAIIINYNGPALVVGLTSSQAGVLSLQRYADLAGTIPVGAAITQNLTAATAASVGVNDGLPYLSFAFSITNTSGSTAANVTNLSIVSGPR
jgi:hypothetical protein